MNVVNAVVRVLRGSQMTDEDGDKQFLIRLKEADETNDRLERRIIEMSDGRSVAETLYTLTKGLDQVWATWIKKHMPEALQKLEQRGFIRVEKRVMI